MLQSGAVSCALRYTFPDPARPALPLPPPPATTFRLLSRCWSITDDDAVDDIYDEMVRNYSDAAAANAVISSQS